MAIYTEFVAGDNTLAELSRILSKSRRADVAIAYWGAGAIEALGIDRAPGTLRILCDAYSGACNPEELATLLEMKNVRIKTRNDLHAKVWIFTPPLMFVGSANASANGLGQEGIEARNIEAGVLVRERSCINNARAWFRSAWRDGFNVTSRVIHRIRPIWEGRRRGRPAHNPNFSSVLQVLRENPGWFKDREIRVVAAHYLEGSKQATAKFNAIPPSLYHPRALKKYNATEHPPYYEDNGKWRISEGDYVIDYNVDEKRGRATYRGIWRIRTQDAFHRAGGSRLVLCDRVRDFKGLTLSPSEGRRLGKLIVDYLSSTNFRKNRDRSMLDAPLYEVAHLCLRGR